jgi:hypothetical protein
MNIVIKSTTIGIIPILLTQNSYCDNVRITNKTIRDKNIIDVGNRLKMGLDEDNIRLIKESPSGMKVYSPKVGNFYTSYSENKSFNNISRVATVEINSSVENVASMWLTQGINRKEWDKTIKNSNLIKRNEDGSYLTYIEYRKPGLIIPGRDYVFNITQAPGAVIGSNSFTTQCLVSTDENNAIDQSWFNVRGNINSILVLEPKGTGTLVHYIIEINPKGWLKIPIVSLISDSIIGDRQVNVLESLKESLEEEDRQKNIDQKDGGKILSIEETARLRFKKSQKDKEDKNKSNSIIDDSTVSKEDLLQTISILEKRLINLKKTEKQDKIDLRDLKNRVENDIDRTKLKLRNY